MSTKHTSVRTRTVDVPYDPRRRKATSAFWATATAHDGVAGWRVALGSPPMVTEDREEPTALRGDDDPSR